jgi:hypothetical protein
MRLSDIRATLDEFRTLIMGARSQAGVAFQAATRLFTLARGWADNPGVVSPIAFGGTIGAHVSVTPRVTGRLRVIVTAALDNTTGGTLSYAIGVSHAGSLVPDYAGSVALVAAGFAGSMSLVVDLDQLTTPIIFPLNALVEIDALFAGNGGQIDAHACQIEVQEVI